MPYLNSKLHSTDLERRVRCDARSPVRGSSATQKTVQYESGSSRSIRGKVRSRLCQMGGRLRSERDHVSSILCSPRRGIAGCSLENPVPDGDSKTRQVAQREKCQEVRKARSAVVRNIEVVPRHAGLWTAGDRSHVTTPRRRPEFLFAGAHDIGDSLSR